MNCKKIKIIDPQAFAISINPCRHIVFPLSVHPLFIVHIIRMYDVFILRLYNKNDMVHKTSKKFVHKYLLSRSLIIKSLLNRKTRTDVADLDTFSSRSPQFKITNLLKFEWKLKVVNICDIIFLFIHQKHNGNLRSYSLFN